MMNVRVAQLGRSGWAVAAVVSITVLALLAVGLARASEADAHSNHRPSGCTLLSKDSYTCLYLWGIKGTGHVEKMMQVRAHPWRTCNYQANFRVTRNGTTLYNRNSAFKSGCSYYPRNYAYSPTIEKTFPTSRACGTWYENYGMRIGTACLNLYN